MSRLSNLVEKPFTKTLQWKNEKFDKKLKEVTQEKGWYYYVKSEIEGEKGANIMIEMPFTFIWLLDTTSFSGYNEAEKVSVYSNEVLNVMDLKQMFPKEKTEGVEEYNYRLKSYQNLTAKMGKENIATGVYGDIKDKVVAKGGKYCKPVYALLQTDEGTEIVRILMSGSSIETWIPFSNPVRLKNHAVSCAGSVEKTKGSNDYEAPTFKYVTANAELLKEADKAALQVEMYFKYLLSSVETNSEELEEVETKVEDDLPF